MQIGHSTLFIHGADGHYVPVQMPDAPYDTAACPKCKLFIPGAGRAAAPVDHDYIRRLQIPSRPHILMEVPSHD